MPPKKPAKPAKRGGGSGSPKPSFIRTESTDYVQPLHDDFADVVRAAWRELETNYRARDREGFYEWAKMHKDKAWGYRDTLHTAKATKDMRNVKIQSFVVNYINDKHAKALAAGGGTSPSEARDKQELLDIIYKEHQLGESAKGKEVFEEFKDWVDREYYSMVKGFAAVRHEANKKVRAELFWLKFVGAL